MANQLNSSLFSKSFLKLSQCFFVFLFMWATPRFPRFELPEPLKILVAWIFILYYWKYRYVSNYSAPWRYYFSLTMHAPALMLPIFVFTTWKPSLYILTTSGFRLKKWSAPITILASPISLWKLCLALLFFLALVIIHLFIGFEVRWSIVLMLTFLYLSSFNLRLTGTTAVLYALACISAKLYGSKLLCFFYPEGHLLHFTMLIITQRWQEVASTPILW